MIIKNNKKGAMFGLDARIALAIFGALSVISGAALYSAIQEAKVIALTTDMNEIGKAYEAYILDTSSEIEKEFNVFGLTGRLIINTTPQIQGWNGPYINMSETISAANKYIKHPKYNDYIVLDFAEDKDWTSVTDNRASGAPCTTANTTCWTWVRIQSDFSLSLMKAVDLKIDGDDSAWNGNFRYRYKADNSLQEAYLKYTPSFKQPNL